MRYFWHAIAAIVVLSLIVMIFFAFSVKVDDNISFTNDLPELTAPVITIADPQQGPSDAVVTIVNFGDYSCEACGDLDETLAAFMATYAGQIRLVWKDMPNTSAHPEALNAAMAARCAGEQDADLFFAYQAYLFANQANLGAELYTTLAEELGLKASALTRCVENEDTFALVQRTYEEGLALRITATPTLFINGERYSGGLSSSELSATLRTLLR